MGLRADVGEIGRGGKSSGDQRIAWIALRFLRERSIVRGAVVWKEGDRG